MRTLILIILVLGFVGINAQESESYINVMGISEITVPADQINFTIHIKTIDKSIEQSKKEAMKTMDQMKSVLSKFQIDSSSIEISPIFFGRNYVYHDGEKERKGFYTWLTVSFLLKDLSEYYNLFDTISSDSSLEIRSKYGISNSEEIEKKAYKKTLNEAKEKAEYMVESIGLKLGKVIEIDEFKNRAIPYSVNAFSATVVRKEENFGKVSIKRKVRVKFELND